MPYLSFIKSTIDSPIDLLNLKRNSQQALILAQLLKSKQPGSILSGGEGTVSEVRLDKQKYKVYLSHTVIFRKRQSTKNLPTKEKQPGFRCEIINNTPFIIDTHGTLYAILKTLSLKEDCFLIDREETEQEGVNKQRIVKVQTEEDRRRHLVNREAAIMHSISHLHAKDLIRDNFTGKNYIVMRRLPGQDLFKYLEPRCFHWNVDDRLRLFLTLLIAIRDQAHSLGLVHGDIKPENIMLAFEPGSNIPQINMVDYGCSKYQGEKDNDFFCGTLEYASPESLRFEERTQASDIFSLGKVTYELFFGIYTLYHSDLEMMCRLKFRLKTGGRLAEEEIQWIVSLGLDLENAFKNEWEDLSESHQKMLQAILKSMLALNPDNRFSLDQLIKRVQTLWDSRIYTKNLVRWEAQQSKQLELALNNLIVRMNSTPLFFDCTRAEGMRNVYQKDEKELGRQSCTF